MQVKVQIPGANHAISAAGIAKEKEGPNISELFFALDACPVQATRSVQVENRLQDGVVRIDGEAIDTKAMSASRGLGIFENW